MRSDFFYAIEEARTRHYREMYSKMIDNKRLKESIEKPKVSENQIIEKSSVVKPKYRKENSSKLERALNSIISYFESDIADNYEKEVGENSNGIDWEKLSKIREQKINELSKA